MKNLNTPTTVPVPPDQQKWLGTATLTLAEMHQLQLEQRCLAAGLLASVQKSDWAQSVLYVTPSCFEFSEHGQMWEAMVSADGAGALTSLTDKWPASMLYISSIMDGIAQIPSLLADTASQLYDAYRERRLRQVMATAGLCQNPAQMYQQLKTGMAEWEAADLKVSPSTVKQDVVQFMEDMEKAMKGGARTLWTGIRPLDDSIQGIMGGEYVVLAGRPGSGKTSLACNNIQHQCEQGLGVVFCSLEMTRNQVIARLVQQMTGVSAKWLLTGDRRMADHLHKVQRAVETIAEWPLVIYDHSGLAETSTVPMLLQRAQKEVGDISLVVYDHLGEATKTAENKQQETTAKSGILRDIAKDTGAVVMSLVQMNRDIEKGGKNAEGKLKRTPQMSDLRDAGEIEEQASLILFTHNQEQIVVAKSRYGTQDMVDCRFRKAWTRWS